MLQQKSKLAFKKYSCLDASYVKLQVLLKQIVLLKKCNFHDNCMGMTCSRVIHAKISSLDYKVLCYFNA